MTQHFHHSVGIFLNYFDACPPWAKSAVTKYAPKSPGFSPKYSKYPVSEYLHCVIAIVGVCVTRICKARRWPQPICRTQGSKTNSALPLGPVGKGPLPCLTSVCSTSKRWRKDGNTPDTNVTNNNIIPGKHSVQGLVWLRGLSAGLRTKGSLVRFPVRAQAWVAGQVPKRGRSSGSHTLMFLSLPPSFPLFKNKEIKSFFFFF